MRALLPLEQVPGTFDDRLDRPGLPSRAPLGLLDESFTFRPMSLRKRDARVEQAITRPGAWASFLATSRPRPVGPPEVFESLDIQSRLLAMKRLPPRPGHRAMCIAATSLTST
jgi:hypothetical protein